LNAFATDVVVAPVGWALQAGVDVELAAFMDLKA
jgi:hypothetical protein